jgi:selenoprotein W-related protein
LALKESIKSLTLAPGTRGAFEIIVNGKKIYSKLQTGEFPDFDAITTDVEKLS